MIFFRMFFGSLLQLAPFAALCIVPFAGHLRYPKRRAALLTAGLLLGLCLLFAAACVYLATVYPVGQALFNGANAVFMVCLVPCLLWYLFLVREIWQKKLFLFFFALTSALAMVSVCNMIETWLEMGQQVDGLPYYGHSIFIIAGLTAALLPPLFLLLKHGYLPISDDLNGKESGYLSVLAILLFVVLACGLVPINYENIYNPMSLFLFFALLVAVFIVYFFYFKLILHNHEKLQAQQQLAQVEHQLALRDEQYHRISDSIESSRRTRHDFRHHIITLQGFLAAGQVAQAEQYLNQYIQTLNEDGIAKFCENTVVNVLVNHYGALAKEKGFEFTARIELPAIMVVEDLDLSVLLGNLLENAIEGAAHAPQGNRSIRLAVFYLGNMLAITVDNGFDGVVQQVKGGYLSRKEGHTGIGLKSIESIALKYGGGLDLGHDGAQFHASVMLCMATPLQR